MTTTMFAGFSSLFGFGLIVAFLGSIKLVLAMRIGADNAQFGRVIAVFQWIMVVMAIAGGVTIDLVGHQVAICAGSLLSAIAISWIGRTRSTPVVLGCCTLLGIGAQLLYASGNTLLPSLFADPSAGSSLGNAVCGLGALLMSIIAAALFKRMTFERALSLLAFVLLIPLGLALLGTFPATVRTLGERTFDVTVAVSLLGNYVLWIAALLLFCYIGLEVSMGAWISSYATELGADGTQAVHTLSIFWVAMMVSRLCFGLQDQLTGIQLTPVGGTLLVVAGLTALVALTMLMRSRNLQSAQVWIFVVGFVFGPIFPTTIGITLEHFAPSTWGTLFGVVATAGSVGAALIPPWIGRKSTTRTMQASFGILRSTAFGVTAIALILALLPAM
ncbi:MAG: MFS transporter [Caldilineaceae bacterium]